MKFVPTEERLFWWPVSVRTPDPDKPGAVVVEKYEARFRALTRSRALVIEQAMRAAGSDAERSDREHDLLRETVVDLRGIEGADGEALAFTPLLLDQLIEFSWHRAGLYEAYAQAMRGEEARIKN